MKNYGCLYLFGESDIAELKTKAIKEPSEEMLNRQLERKVAAVQRYFSSQNISFDAQETKRFLKIDLKSLMTVRISPQEGYVFIDSEGYGLMNITEIAKDYSLSTHLPTLFWSGFDDSIMILGVAADGEIQTVHIISDEEEDSWFAAKKGAGDIFRKYIPIKDEDAFNKLLLEQDVFEAQELVLSAFGITYED